MSRRAKSGAGQPPSQRQLRAGELIRHALTGILRESNLRDPALQDVLITVGEVRCSLDLKHAHVFVTPLGDETQAGRTGLANALNRARAYLRGQLAREIELRFTPELRFIADTSYDEGVAMDRLLSDPRVRRDLETDGE